MNGMNVSLPVYLLDENQSLANKNWKVKIRAFNKNLVEIKLTEYKGFDNRVYNKKLGEFTLTSEQTKSNPLLFVSEVYAGDSLLSRTFYYMNYEKEKGCIFNLPRTTLSMVTGGGKAVIKNTGKYPAVGVNIQSPGNSDKFTASDNFFWLNPGENKAVEVNITKNIKVDSWNLKGNEIINTVNSN